MTAEARPGIGRLHEIAKVLGVPAKTLMGELAAQGFEFKTHMATLDANAFDVLKKKYKDLDAKWDAHLKELAAAPPAPIVKRKPKSAKPITQRNTAAKGAKDVPDSPEPEPTKEVEFVRREEGLAGTVTMEQRVVGGGVLRRRRVEDRPAPPPVVEPTPVQEAPEQTASETQPKSPVIEAPVSTELSQQESIETAEDQPEEVQTEKPVEVSPKPAEPVQTRPASPAVRTSPLVAPSGRNLSAPSRLRIVDQPPIPPRPATPVARPASGTVAKTPIARPAEGSEASEEAKREAAKKKAAAPKEAEVPGRLTKRDLIGMMEEVEITRPLGRRPKKAGIRIEKKTTQITTPGAAKRKIRIENEITVGDLADRMGLKAADVVRKLISQGQMVTVQHHLDFDTAALIAGEYNYEVQNVAETVDTFLEADRNVDADGALESRAPIVTIMGHVDHGKTSLLDFIRKTRVVAGEAGGITQHIGAYQVEHNSKKITFIDTPGHAAFTAMRARGASLTDIVILVVAADEGAKPQTLEALAHAQAAKVPVIVAINKIDKPEAKPDQVMQELSGHGLLPEAWGGETIYVKLSALTGQGIPELLEMILLQAEVLDLKASSTSPGKGIIIESRLDKGKGPVATVIVQQGTIHQGSPLVSGASFGKVRALFNDRGQSVKSAGPSTPVEILGFDSAPKAGDILTVVSDDAVARRASELATLAKKKTEALKSSRMSLEDMYQKMKAGDVSELRVVLKGDVQGSIEAIADSLAKIKHEKVRVEVLYKAVGGISESDIDLAAASGALILGFNVRPTNQAKQLAVKENVQVKTYEIIYQLLDDVKLAMQGLLAPIIKENTLGQAEVRNVFTISKVGPVAGSFVKSGKILRNAQGRLIRDSVVVYTGRIIGLKRFKDDTREVLEGFECGIRIENYSDVKVGDIIECFENVEMAQAVG